MKPVYKLFKNLNQTALGSVESRNKDDPCKLLNIKDNLLLLCRRKLELFNKHKTVIDAEFPKTHAKFKPLHYNTHAECFESLKSLFKFENFLRIIYDIDSSNTNTGPTVVKSYSIETLGKKFEKDFKNLNNEENYQNLYSKFEYLCTVVLSLTKEILLLPIVSKFDVERHFNNIYKFIKNLFDKLQEESDWIKDKINMMLKCYKLLDNLKKYSANELFKFIENDAVRSSNLFEFYYRLYGKKEDYNLLVLEKIVCDYTNTMQSILKGIEVSSQYSLKTFIPLRVSEDENLLVKAFKINLKDDIKNIKVYNYEGHEVTLIENSDYIILKSYKMSTYILPFEVIRKHKIDNIEVIVKSGEKKYFDSFVSYLSEKISRIQIN